MASKPLTCVVVGIDGSSTSEEAVRWATRRVSPDGIVHLVHVAEGEPDHGGGGAAAPDRLELLHRADAAADGPAPRTVDVRHGHPAEVLVAEAATRGAELIMVGAHGSGRSRSWAPIIGSVTRSLLHRSERPLIIHHGGATTDGGPVIGCVGYGPPAEAAVAWAARYAQSAQHRLQLLHAVSDRPVFPLDGPLDTIGSYLGPGVDRGWAQEDLTELAEELGATAPGLDVSTEVTRGSAVRAILDAAETEQGTAELIVLGRYHGGTIGRLPISPRTRQIIAGAPCPTAVVPSCQPMT